MKIIWCGDAACASGFARCSHAVCNYLHSLGHEIHILGLNYLGDPHEYPYTIYPCFQPSDLGTDHYGIGRLPSLIHRLKPDIVVLLQDPWNVRGYLDNLLASQVNMPPMIAWLAVDSRNQKSAKELNHSHLSHVVTWTEFGAKELIAGGYTGPLSIVPCGVDVDLFKPLDKTESRIKVLGDDYSQLPDNPFIVGYVGRNQYRKRLDLTIEYFSDWIHRSNISNAYLMLHIPPTGEDHVDIISLARYYDIGEKLIVSSPMRGFEESSMALIYNCFDVFLSTSQAEGWNLPALESMACGIPVIVPDQGATGLDGGWITEKAAIQIPCNSTALTAPHPVGMYTIGGIPDKEETINALGVVYNKRILGGLGLKVQQSIQAGVNLAHSLTWEQSAEKFTEVINHVVDPRNETCSWPECSKPALCSSGNYNNGLVCSDHFNITNGTLACL